MALSDYTLRESEPPSFYDFTPEEYNLDRTTPPGPEPPSIQRSVTPDVSSWYGFVGSSQPSTPGGENDLYGYVPSVYSGSKPSKSSGSSGQWWKDQGIGDWGDPNRGSAGGGSSTGFSSGMTMPQPYISHRAPPPDVPVLSPYEMPERGTAPVFNAPEWDQSEINRLSQEHAAAPIRTLREAYQRVAARLPTNPQSRLLLKDALAGYGSGLESAISGAKRTARAEYGQEHGREFQAEGIKYQGAQREFEADYATKLAQAQQQAAIENQNKMMQYQADYNEYLQGGTGSGSGSGGRVSATNLMQQNRADWLKKVEEYQNNK